MKVIVRKVALHLDALVPPREEILRPFLGERSVNHSDHACFAVPLTHPGVDAGLQVDEMAVRDFDVVNHQTHASLSGLKFESPIFLDVYNGVPGMLERIQRLDMQNCPVFALRSNAVEKKLTITAAALRLDEQRRTYLKHVND